MQRGDAVLLSADFAAARPSFAKSMGVQALSEVLLLIGTTGSNRPIAALRDRQVLAKSSSSSCIYNAGASVSVSY